MNVHLPNLLTGTLSDEWRFHPIIIHLNPLQSHSVKKGVLPLDKCHPIWFYTGPLTWENGYDNLIFSITW